MVGAVGADQEYPDPRLKPGVLTDREFALVSRYRGKTILISGGMGYIGLALTQALSQVDCRLLLLDCSPPPETSPSQNTVQLCSLQRLSYIQGDVTSLETWKGILDDVDLVFHLAAFEHKHGSPFDPFRDEEVNARSTLYMLEACRAMGVSPRIVFSSSSNLVGLPATYPVDETFPDQPLTVYAIHKQTSEKYLNYYARVFGIPAVTLRLVNIYGPVPSRETAGKVVINRIIQRALKGETLTLYQNHACMRDYLFIDDVVRAFLAAGVDVPDARGQYYVIGSGEGMRISDAVQLIAERVAHKTGIEVNIMRNDDVQIELIEWRNLTANSARFMADAGWEPCVAFRDGIDRTIEAFL